MTAPESQPIAPTAVDGDEKTYCAVHPDVETGLRCSRCGRYMCVRCAVPTPVGYKCRECVNQHQDAFYKATPRDNLVAFAIALGLSIPLGFVLGKMLFLAILFGLPAGAAIGELVWRATGRRRGRYVPLLVGVGILLGVLIGNLPAINDFVLFANEVERYRAYGIDAGSALGDAFFSLFLAPVAFAILSIITAVGRVRV
ncbi:MAG: hypothetical protein IT323_07510 [Anaerolineae bacterium]|nr:hypothetical protein [Anaerolineae bacterium]